MDSPDALMGPQGLELLAQLPPYREQDVVSLTTKLRAEYEPELIAAALTQSRLRAKGTAKFGDRAAHMFFTADALEQATRPAIGRRHAQRFVDAGITQVFDGGCGIGADSLSFAEAGLAVTAIEADAATAQLAAANLADFSQARVVASDLEAFMSETTPDTAWWFDPARRLPGVADIHGRTKRTFSLDALSPSWDLITSLAMTTRAAGAKLSPSFQASDMSRGSEAEYVSYAGEVLECALWWGDAARHPGCTATIIKPGTDGDRAQYVVAEDAAGADLDTVTRATLGPYFYEADKALTRSGLVGAMLNAIDGREFTSGYGYATSDTLCDIGLLGRGYKILDAVPAKEKTLRAYMRTAGVGNLTIKKRDVDTDADVLRKGLKLKGSAAMTIVLVDLDDERTALVVEPL